MKDDKVLMKLKGKLIVSCQALPGEPLYGAEIMARMALAAMIGGAAGIRANSVEDIAEIKKLVNLPVIGIIKKDYGDSEVYITPTIKEVEELCGLGVDIVATDFTNRTRPYGQTLEAYIKEVKEKFPNQIIMADISTYEEGLMAEKLGVDLVSTTLSGYTSYSPNLEGPDFELVEKLTKIMNIPVIAEGRIHGPEDAKRLLECGAYALIVGGAITRPLEITRRFVSEIQSVV